MGEPRGYLQLVKQEFALEIELAALDKLIAGLKAEISELIATTEQAEAAAAASEDLEWKGVELHRELLRQQGKHAIVLGRLTAVQQARDELSTQLQPGGHGRSRPHAPAGAPMQHAQHQHGASGSGTTRVPTPSQELPQQQQQQAAGSNDAPGGEESNSGSGSDDAPGGEESDDESDLVTAEQQQADLADMDAATFTARASALIMQIRGGHVLQLYDHVRAFLGMHQQQHRQPGGIWDELQKINKGHK